MTKGPLQRDTATSLTALGAVVAAATRSELYRGKLNGVDPARVLDRTALAELPVTRKSDLPALQRARPPFAGNPVGPSGAFSRFFGSPGPIFEPERNCLDPWRGAGALEAAGFRAGDVVLNTFSYHMTPGGFAMDASARAIGCIVIPAGPGNREHQLDLIEAYRPTAYCGTPDFLKILQTAYEVEKPGSFSIRKAAVSGAAFPKSLQDEMKAAGIDAYQSYACAEFGVIAYETSGRDGLVVNSDLIVEIVQPGSNNPLPDGEVGEVVVTALDPVFPLLRIAVGDLSAIVPGEDGRCRLKGWLGRADQTAKIKGMFVRPEQISKLMVRFPMLGKVRLVVQRVGEEDMMLLVAETSDLPSAGLHVAVTEALHEVTKLRGEVSLVARGTLPNDGKVIADERPAP